MVGAEGTGECGDVADLQSASCRSSLIEGAEGRVECRDVADLQSASCRSSLIEGAEGRVECSDVADLQPVLGANASMLAHASKIDIKRRIILAFMRRK